MTTIAPLRTAEGKTDREVMEDALGEWVRVRTEPGPTPCSLCIQGALRAAPGCWRLGQPNAAQEQP